MRDAIRFLGIVILVTGLVIVFETPIKTTVSQVYQHLAPCAVPVTYKIGSIDPRFGVATSTFLADLNRASTLWNDVHNKTLFSYNQDSGEVTINFIYDKRQEVSQELNSLDTTISTDRSQYDTLKSHYDAAAADLEQKKALFETSVAVLNTRQAAYNSSVQMWNARGGAPPSVYTQLQSEHTAISEMQDQLSAQQTAVNAEVESVNAQNDKLNAVIAGLNSEATTYNTTNAATGDFEEGVYISDAGKQTINIYEYSSQIKLLRVLAHELGHALGLNHVTDPVAIMYAQNQGTSLSATAADIAELDAVCHTK